MSFAHRHLKVKRRRRFARRICLPSRLSCRPPRKAAETTSRSPYRAKMPAESRTSPERAGCSNRSGATPRTPAHCVRPKQARSRLEHTQGARAHAAPVGSHRKSNRRLPDRARRRPAGRSGGEYARREWNAPGNARREPPRRAASAARWRAAQQRDRSRAHGDHRASPPSGTRRGSARPAARAIAPHGTPCGPSTRRSNHRWLSRLTAPRPSLARGPV